LSSAAFGRRRLRVAIVDGFGIADVLVLVFDIVAGRQDPQQVALGDLLPGNGGGSHKGLVDLAIVAASPGVISPHASAVVTAFIARATFCSDGSSISPLPMAASDGSENVTGRSWHRGSTRSRHSFIANISPASPASTALRVCGNVFQTVGRCREIYVRSDDAENVHVVDEDST
jgi:hypothetical protein